MCGIGSMKLKEADKKSLRIVCILSISERGVSSFRTRQQEEEVVCLYSYMRTVTKSLIGAGV